MQGFIHITDSAIDPEITEEMAQEHVWVADLILRYHGLYKSVNYIIMTETDQITGLLQIKWILPMRMQGFSAISESAIDWEMTEAQELI